MQRFISAEYAWIQAAHYDGLSECVHMLAAPVYASEQGAGQDYATLREEVWNRWMNCMPACACA